MGSEIVVELPAPMSALLSELVDYAGLFPPAALPMSEAVAKYASYTVGPQRAMLGRFVLPAARLDEFLSCADALETPATPWRLSALADPDDAEPVARFNRWHSARFIIDAVETKANDVATIWRIASAFDESYAVFVEIPVAADPSGLIDELAARGLRAKIRTGGVTADAFPSAGEIVRFMALCARQGVPFKATAGLHHPMRGEYPLTYAPGSDRATMHGFLGVFLAAALLYDGSDERDVASLLEEGALDAISVDEDGISWKGHRVTAAEIARARAEFAASFGSCSFEEPVQDLMTLNLIPAP